MRQAVKRKFTRINQTTDQIILAAAVITGAIGWIAILIFGGNVDKTLVANWQANRARDGQCAAILGAAIFASGGNIECAVRRCGWLTIGTNR